MESKCEVCHKPAHQKCAGCLTVFYCSPAHQKEHWKSHQRSCSYFVIRDDPELGKGFYASRDIKAGTIIHEEIPFVFAPSWPANSFNDVPYCVSCGVGSRHIEASLKRCGRCKWPYCSSECQKIHTVNECQIFVSKRFIFPPTSMHIRDIPDLLLMIRTAVAKKKRPGVFQNILQLRSTSDEPDMANDVHGDENIEPTLGCISPFVNADDLQLSSQDFKKLMKILRLNCFFTVDRAMQILENPFSRAPLSDYLYPKASQMQHSCSPNCSWMISWRPDFKIRVRTAVPIKKGEPLKISYYLRAGTKNRMDRVQTIRFRLGQWCKCCRCNDPTELGTCASAVICSKKCRNKKDRSKPVGYMLPEDPLSLSFTSHWRCSACGVRKVGYNVSYDVQKLGDTIFRMEMDCSSTSNTEGLIAYCKDLIAKHSGKTVHPNHWVVQDATRTILKYLPVHCNHSMDLKTSQYYVKCGQYLLGIQDVVSPGISYERAVLQKQIATALQDQVTELCSQKKYKEALSNIEQCLKLQTEALVYFKDDFPKNDGYISDADELRVAMESATSSRDEIASMIDDELKCVLCGKQAYQNCPQCHLVTYCSTEHRQKHWKLHRKSCSCFVIKEGSGSNKGFFALRNIETGTVILEETPVVYGPSWNIPSFNASFCITCGVELHLAEVASPRRRCSKCNWPSCCFGCHLIHNENECKIFEMAEKRLNFPPVGHFTPGEIRDLVLIIRTTILKKKNPGIYHQILELQFDSAESDYNDYNVEGVFRLLGPLVNSDGANIDQEEFKKLFKILRMNCHSTAIVLPDCKMSDSRSHKNEYVYLRASKLEQSCVPNCNWEISGRPDFKIRIRATQAVKEGEALTINYNVRGFEQGTKQRQEIIRKMRGSWCTCSRCKDPLELGTYASAITCKMCTAMFDTSDDFSHFLAEDPLDLRDSAKWKCNRCGELKLSSIILPPVEQIQKLVSKKVKECKEKSKTGALINYCKTVIKKYSGESLHPNHWVLQNATRMIFQHLPGHCGGSMDLETTRYYAKCGMYLLRIQDIVSPGSTLSRANLQKQIATALLQKHVQKELHNQKRHQEALDNLQHCLKLLTEAYNYYEGSESRRGIATKLKMEIYHATAAVKVLAQAMETKRSE